MRISTRVGFLDPLPAFVIGEYPICIVFAVLVNISVAVDHC